MADKKSLKAILIGAAIVILAVSLSVGATLFFLSGPEDETTEAGAEVAAQATASAPTMYFTFEKPFITGVQQDDRARYMQVSVALVFRDAAVEKALETHRPLIRSRLLTLFGQGDFIALQSEAGRQNLKNEALKAINAVLDNEEAPPVDKVLFTNFVLQ